MNYPSNLTRDEKKDWLEALRSGEYKQGKGKLRRTVKGEVRHCCLGVLCDLRDPEGWGTKSKHSWHDVKSDDVCTEDNDRGIIDWDQADALLSISVPYGLRVTHRLAGLNDGGRSFEEIACFIENNMSCIDGKL